MGLNGDTGQNRVKVLKDILASTLVSDWRRTCCHLATLIRKTYNPWCKMHKVDKATPFFASFSLFPFFLSSPDSHQDKAHVCGTYMRHLHYRLLLLALTLCNHPMIKVLPTHYLVPTMYPQRLRLLTLAYTNPILQSRHVTHWNLAGNVHHFLGYSEAHHAAV